MLALFLNELLAAACYLLLALKVLYMYLKINHFQVFSEAATSTISNLFIFFFQ